MPIFVKNFRKDKFLLISSIKYDYNRNKRLFRGIGGFYNMPDKIIRNGRGKIEYGQELPYVGQVVPFGDEYYSIIRLVKVEWVENGLRVHFVMEKLEDESVVVTDAEVRKAKKSKFKVL